MSRVAIGITTPEYRGETTEDFYTMPLPTQKSQTIQRLQDSFIFIFGERKIGKTSIFANFPNALFIMFEPGGGGIDMFKIDIEYTKDKKSGWAHFLRTLKELEEEKEKGSLIFEFIVMDTLDRMYDACMSYVGEKEGFEHPSDPSFAYGKGWSLVDKEFNRGVQRLLSLGVGVGATSHVNQKEFTSRTFGTYSKYVASASKQAYTCFASIADIIGFYGYVGNERVLIIEGSEDVDCGRRLKNNFLTPDGQKILSVPMGRSDEEAYANLVNAFNNKQEDINDPSEFKNAPIVERAVMTGKKK